MGNAAAFSDVPDSRLLKINVFLMEADMVKAIFKILGFILLAVLFGAFVYAFEIGSPYNYKDGLGVLAYILCYDLILIIGISLLTSYRNTTYEIIYYPLGIIFFVFMLHHFVALVRLGIGDTTFVFNPGFFIPVALPIIIVFALLIRRIKYWYILMLLVLTIPVPFIIKDQIEIDHYKNTCNQNTPKAWYDPIYLPIDFFHEEKDNNGVTKRVPNVVIPSLSTSKDPSDIYGNVFYYNGNHPALDTQVMKELFITGNIVLYEKYQELNECPQLLQEQKTPQKYNCIPKGTKIRPFSKTVYRLNKDRSSTPVAIFFAQEYIGTPFMRKLFPNYNKISCKYNLNDRYRLNQWYRRSEQAFENYIKLKK